MADPKSTPLTLEFGGGINSRASERSINPMECSSGGNFILDTDRRSLIPRPPFDLAGTAPNGESINGFAQLFKADGTISTLIQAGGNVYSWDGSAAWSLVGTVSTAARLRGPLTANDQLAAKVLIADLALQAPVKTWDGTTFATAAFNLSNEFRARYCFVANDRAWFANVLSNGTATPHVICASEVEDYTQISVANRPSSSLGAADPFYLTAPDLRYINGLVPGFGKVIFSTKQGAIYALEGSNAKDFEVIPYYQGSGAAGDEAVIAMGADVVYGAAGRIESAIANSNIVGYVQTDDLTRPIFPDVQDYNNWTAAFNNRLQRAYFFPADQPECWVYHKAIADAQLPFSPWSKFETDHPVDFQPTAVWSMYDPADGLEKVYFGDALGNVYRMEGSGTLDGGTAAVTVTRVSPMIEAPPNSEAFNLNGIVQYRRQESATLTMDFLWNGTYPMTTSVGMTLTGATGGFFWGGGTYASGTISLSDVPSAGTEIDVGNSGEGVVIGGSYATPEDYAAALSFNLNLNALSFGSRYITTVSGAVVTVTALDSGPGSAASIPDHNTGNYIVLEKSGDTGSAVTLSGPTLSGGYTIPDAAPELYWGDSGYWGLPFSGRLVRQKYDAGGQGDQFQVRVNITGEGPFEIDKILCNVTAA